MRDELAALLIARGFPAPDATAFVGRLSDQQVAEDLRWHRWEQSWFAQGPATSWPPEIRAQVTAHYLGPAHNLAPWDLMAMDAALAPRTAAPTPPSGAGVAIVGVLVIIGAAGVAYALARR